MMYNLKNVNEGFFKFLVYGKLYEVLAEYNIIDYSNEQGTMYLVQFAKNPTEQMWVDSFVKAQDLCKADYKARFC